MLLIAGAPTASGSLVSSAIVISVGLTIGLSPARAWSVVGTGSAALLASSWPSSIGAPAATAVGGASAVWSGGAGSVGAPAVNSAGGAICSETATIAALSNSASTGSNSTSTGSLLISARRRSLRPYR